MDNDNIAETVHNLEALVATLTELLDVEEKVVGEQSDRLKQDDEDLIVSNNRFIAFIKEATMRLKNPLEVVEENLAIVAKEVEQGELECANVSLQLKVQIKNIEQIRKNIIELNKAIVDHAGKISDASKKFLTE